MIVEILVFLATSLFAYLVYAHLRIHSVWRRKDVRFLPGVPLFGNNMKSLLSRRHVMEDIDECYAAFPNEKYFGYIEGISSVIVVRDPELIKQITIKDFDYFADHRQFFNVDLFNDSLLFMKGDRWRDMRSTLSPAFTGSKMRGMVPFMIETSEAFMEYLKGSTGTDVNMDDTVRRYTNDIIASTAFGHQVNSLKDRDNRFYTSGQALMNFSIFQKMLFVFNAICPSLSKIFPIFPAEVTEFFRDMVKRTMEYREQNNIERPDMVQLLMEAAKGTLKSQENDRDRDTMGFATAEDFKVKSQNSIRTWSSDELAAQAFIFFFAGYESSASVLTMAVHELALNPRVQQRLADEIQQHELDEKHLTYESLQRLKYLDAVVNESLRKWTAALVLDRICLKPYVLPPPHEGGKPYQMNVGDVVYNCVNSVHNDPKYFPEPQRFDPDRFSDNNKSSIQPGSFLPFGMGPRNCIGSRFALLEIKIFLYYMVKNFEIVKSSRTLEPIRLSTSSFSVKAEGGTWVQFKTRS